jgi:hypothetical protein
MYFTIDPKKTPALAKEDNSYLRGVTSKYFGIPDRPDIKLETAAVNEIHLNTKTGKLEPVSAKQIQASNAREESNNFEEELEKFTTQLKLKNKAAKKIQKAARGKFPKAAAGGGGAHAVIPPPVVRAAVITPLSEKFTTQIKNNAAKKIQDVVRDKFKKKAAAGGGGEELDYGKLYTQDEEVDVQENDLQDSLLKTPTKPNMENLTMEEINNTYSLSNSAVDNYTRSRMKFIFRGIVAGKLGRNLTETEVTSVKKKLNDFGVSVPVTLGAKKIYISVANARKQFKEAIENHYNQKAPSGLGK